MTALVLSILVLYGVAGQIDFTGEVTWLSVGLGISALLMMVWSVRKMEVG